MMIQIKTTSIVLQQEKRCAHSQTREMKYDASYIAHLKSSDTSKKLAQL